VPAANAIAYSPDGKLIACASSEVTLIDAHQLVIARTVTGHAQPLLSVTFSPDSKMVVFSGHDQMITFRDVASGDYLAGLPSPAHGHARELVFSPDGRKLLPAAVVLPDMQLSMVDLDYPRRLLVEKVRFEQARRVLQQDPSDPSALATVGHWCAECGNWNDAVRYLAKAREQGAEISPRLLAQGHWKLGQAAEAKDQFAKALQNAKAAKVLGEVDHLKMCIEALEGAAPIADRCDVDFHYAIGHSYETKNNWEEAIDHYDLVIAAQPERADIARHRKAVVQSRQANSLAQAGRDLDDALSLAQSAIERDPTDAEFLAILGWVHYKRGDFAQAANHLGRAAKDQRPVLGTRATIFDRLGDALWRAGEKENAVTAWRQAQAHAEQLALQVHVARISAKIQAAASGKVPDVAAVPGEPKAAANELVP
jgi:tetratricopeptide (TPR) repeat protein